MQQFPKFLKTTPEFYGLSFYEIGALMVGLYIAMIFNLSPLFTFISSATCIGLLKLIITYFDFKAFLLPKSKELDLKEFKRRTK